MTMPVLSPQGTLLVPVPRETLVIPAELTVGERRLVRKTEHHLTVISFGLGKRLRGACTADPTLEGQLNAAAAAIDWGYALTPDLFHLVEDSVPALETVVVLVEAAGLAAFYAAAARVVPAALAPAFAAAPPAHITLYTSDPDGKKGIGLTKAGDLVAACARARGEPAEKGRSLRAYPLPPGTVAVTKA